MKWIIDNWSLLIVLAAACVFVFTYIKKFASMPNEQQISQVKAWLLFAVIEAEKELGGGTGALKLRYVYDAFLSTFPALVNIVTFETFSEWVDEVLVDMKHLLDTNLDIAYYVMGDDK